MKKHTTSTADNGSYLKPVRENKPNSIGDGLKSSDKEGYPFPSKEDKQFKDQPEFTEPDSSHSVKK